MKRISLLFLTAALLFSEQAFAQGYMTGQAARAVVGQPFFDAQSQNSSDTVIGSAAGVAYADDTLFVADSNNVQATPNNNRVLLFKNISSQIPAVTGQPSNTSLCPVCVGQANVVLGQPNMTTTTNNDNGATQSNLRTPLAVASDGVHVVVADTDQNRVLIWNSIPVSNAQPADVVVGQTNFTSFGVNSTTASTLRSPEGVWIQNGKLYIADTGNNRVVIFNHIPTANGASADIVLGEPDMTTNTQPVLSQQLNILDTNLAATASNMYNPVSVTSDGTRVYVADLGNNRVLIWNSIPTSNGAPADVVVGQPNMTSAISDYAFSGQAAISTVTNVQESPVLCPVSNGVDYNSNPTYPNYCNATISYPRFALSDGTRLYIADGGNDRVLVFNQIPAQNAASADEIIGQIGGDVDQASNAADALESPSSLAWDGTNLYVADVYNRRIMVYTIGANTVPYSGARNAASLFIYAEGTVAVTGTITANDSVAITIGNSMTNTGSACTGTQTSSSTTATTGAANAPEDCGTTYLYTVQPSDTLQDVVDGLVAAINAGSGDPNASAFADAATTTVVLTAKTEGSDGNDVTYVTSTSTSATEILTAAGAELTGGGDASQVAPGSLVSVLGSNLSANTVSANTSAQSLPTTLGGTQVYVNGIAAPLLYVSPNQINIQIPWELNVETTENPGVSVGSVSIWVRSVMSDGSIMTTTPIASTIVVQNPGIFTLAGYTQAPEPGVLFHGSSSANGAVLIDGTINAGDVATIDINNRAYSYTVQSTDSLQTVRDALVAQLNQDPQVYAVAGIAFAVNLQIYARVPGPDGDNIPVNATTTNPSGSASLILTATNTTLCCANVAGAQVTPDNPAVPGEILWVYATGLGLPQITANIQPLINTGQPYPAGGPVTQPVNFVSSLAGGVTANVLSASFLPGTVGVFQVVIQLGTTMPTNYYTQIYIAQLDFISNVVTFPVVSP